MTNGRVLRAGVVGLGMMGRNHVRVLGDMPGIELVAVNTVQPLPEGPEVQLATVFVPDGQLKHFVTRFEEYAGMQTKKGEPRHKDLVDRIAALRASEEGREGIAAFLEKRPPSWRK